jgi:hypothetical protein
MLEIPVPPSNSLMALPVSVIKKSWRCCCNIFNYLNAATLLGSVFELLLLFTCWWHTVCATCWRFQYPKQVTGGFASEFNQEELALLLQHIQVFECRNDAGLCL